VHNGRYFNVFKNHDVFIPSHFFHFPVY